MIARSGGLFEAPFVRARPRSARARAGNERAGADTGAGSSVSRSRTHMSIGGLVAVSPPATMSATVTATAVTTATAAAGTLFARASDIDAESPAAKVLAVHTVNRLLGFLRGAHRDKGEAAGPTGSPIGDKVGFGNGAIGCEGVLQVVLGDFEVEVPDE